MQDTRRACLKMTLNRQIKSGTALVTNSSLNGGLQELKKSPISSISSTCSFHELRRGTVDQLAARYGLKGNRRTVALLCQQLLIFLSTNHGRWLREYTPVDVPELPAKLIPVLSEPVLTVAVSSDAVDSLGECWERAVAGLIVFANMPVQDIYPIRPADIDWNHKEVRLARGSVSVPDIVIRDIARHLAAKIISQRMEIVFDLDSISLRNIVSRIVKHIGQPTWDHKQLKKQASRLVMRNSPYTAETVEKDVAVVNNTIPTSV